MMPAQFDADQTPVWHSAPATDGDLEQVAPGVGIARYRLESVLGEGTYGRVHLARQDVLGRKVAVKILHRRHRSSKHEIRAFANEALILANLNHPGIVPVYDAGWTDDGFFYIVSRFVEGGDLSTSSPGAGTRRSNLHRSSWQSPMPSTTPILEDWFTVISSQPMSSSTHRRSPSLPTSVSPCATKTSVADPDWSARPPT